MKTRNEIARQWRERNPEKCREMRRRCLEKRKQRMLADPQFAAHVRKVINLSRKRWYRRTMSDPIRRKIYLEKCREIQKRNYRKWWDRLMQRRKNDPVFDAEYRRKEGIQLKQWEDRNRARRRAQKRDYMRRIRAMKKLSGHPSGCEADKS